MTKTTVEADGHWLAGLTDGEGCFILSTNRMRYARGYDRAYRCLAFVFKIALRADDIATLHQAQRLLGAGTVRVFQRSGKATVANAKPLATFTIHARADIPIVIEFFRQFPLRSKKARDYAIWSAAFEHLQLATTNSPLTSVRHETLDRPAKGPRRPVAGSTRRRFRTIPDDLWAAMDRYARQLDETRQYTETTA
jgi:hypothetical protein